MPQNRPNTWYERQALRAAYGTRYPTERAKHLAIAGQARIASTERSTPILLRKLKASYDEGAELLRDPFCEEMARRVGLLASQLDSLQSKRGHNRLFLLFNRPKIHSEYTLQHIHSQPKTTSDLPWARRPIRRIPPIFFNKSPVGVTIAIRHTSEIAQLGYDDSDTNDSVQVAHIPYPWRLASSQEGQGNPEFWIGSLVVGKRAIMSWANSDHEDSAAAAFAEQVRSLPKGSWPSVTYNKPNVWAPYQPNDSL